MKFSKCLKLALNILIHSRLRSWLSITGIVIGVASVITILSLGEGMQQSLEERLGGLGADIITVSPGFSRAVGAMGGFHRREGFEAENSAAQKNLTNKDVQALKLVPNIAYIEGVISKRAEIGYLTETFSSSVKGVDTKVWKSIVTTELESGRYLSQGDTNVAVIGNELADDRFKQDIQLNRQITIEGKPFRVVGILKESSGMGSSSGVFIPIETARTTLEDAGEKEFDSIEIKIKDTNLIEETLEQIEKKLMLARAVSEKTKDFSVSSVKAMQETISETLTTMTLFLGAIAAISLLVGAIGIANAMFTTVLEKTKDIGVMKAIGAKNSDILLIFLFSSGMIGLSGGIIGAIFGFIGSKLISTFLASSLMMGGRAASGSVAVITPRIVLLVLSISISIGIISGVIPAYRASKMKPVEALRYE